MGTDETRRTPVPPPPPRITQRPSPRELREDAIRDVLDRLDERDVEAVLHPTCIRHEEDLIWTDLTEGPATQQNLATFTDTAYEGCRTYQDAEEAGRIDENAYEYASFIERYPTPGEREAAMYSVLFHLVRRLAQYQLPSKEAQA